MELLPHQNDLVRRGLKVIEEHGVVYFSAEMRTGKTATGLTLAFALADVVLWVTPKKAIDSIRSDFEKLGINGKLIVINREALHKISKKDLGRKYVVVADESHRDGGWPKVGASCRSLAKYGPSAIGCVLMSGTPSIETAAQLFHQFKWTGHGPWVGFSRFYKWHSEKGVPKTKRVAGGMEVKDYSEMKPEVLDDVSPFVVTLTQKEAGFKHKIEVVPVYLDDPDVVAWGERFGKDGIWEDELTQRTVVGETPAAVLQKQHMALGGTLIDDEGSGFWHQMGGFSKMNCLKRRLTKGRVYFVTTAYIQERSLIAESLSDSGFDVFDDFDEFKKAKGGRVFVGSGISFSEGVDLSWIDSQIIYSLNWSGAKFAQLIERQQKYNREKPAKVYCLLIRGSVDEMVYKAVKGKMNFNSTVYRKWA